MRYRRAVHLSELYFEQNLLFMESADSKRIHNLVRVGVGHLRQIFCLLGIGYASGQNQTCTVSLHLELRIRVCTLNSIAEGGDVKVHDHIENLGSTGFIPQNQAAGSRGFSFHHNLRGRNCQGFDDDGVAGEYPGHRGLHIDEHRLPNEHVNRIPLARLSLLLRYTLDV